MLFCLMSIWFSLIRACSLRVRVLALLAGLLLSGLLVLDAQAQSDPFETDWKTTTDDESITIPTRGGPDVTDYNFTIDWGDGTTETITGDDPDPSHTYVAADTHRVKITGTFPHLFLDGCEAYFCNGDAANAQKLVSVQTWGDIQWESMEKTFAGAKNMTYVAGAPDLSNVTSTAGMFAGAEDFDGNIGTWDVGGITDMSFMFYRALSFNRGEIDGWDVSNVTNMRSMFETAINFDQPLNLWDVSSVQSMHRMFAEAFDFNSAINLWDVSAVTDMSGMFRRATSFNGDLSGWNVGNVTNMSSMFESTNVFNGDISAWDVSSVTNMDGMFLGAIAFSGDLSAWNVASVTTMSGMFSDAAQFNSDLSGWDVSSVTNMFLMFSRAERFNGDVSTWDVSSVTDMGRMFAGAESFNRDIGGWDVSKVTRMTSMFEDATSFDQNLGAWDVSGVTKDELNPLRPGAFENFLRGTGLSTANYGALLQGWAQHKVVSDVSLHGGSSQYPITAAGARQSLIDEKGWTITDGGQSGSPDLFVTTWQTTTDGESITIATGGGPGISDYNATIDWGDGTVETITGDDPDPSHTYATAGTHLVSISGTPITTSPTPTLRSSRALSPAGSGRPFTSSTGCWKTSRSCSRTPSTLTRTASPSRSSGWLTFSGSNSCPGCETGTR
jgi:surface protein